MNSSGTSSWNRSDIELTKISRPFFHRRGSSSEAGSFFITPFHFVPTACLPRSSDILLLTHHGEARRKTHGIAVCAPRRDDCAARDRVPSSLRPLNLRV